MVKNYKLGQFKGLPSSLLWSIIEEEQFFESALALVHLTIGTLYFESSDAGVSATIDGVKSRPEEEKKYCQDLFSFLLFYSPNLLYLTLFSELSLIDQKQIKLNLKWKCPQHCCVFA